MKPSSIDECVENLERLQQRIVAERLACNLKVWENCYLRNVQVLRDYNAWEELQHYVRWFKDYQGMP